MLRLGKRCPWFVGLALLGSGCAQGDQQSDDDVTTVRSALTVPFALPLIAGENPTDFAFAASATLLINDRAHTHELASNADYGLLSNLGSGVPEAANTTNIGVSTLVGTVISKPRVVLRTNATVRGSVYTNPQPTQQTGVTITGFTKVGISFPTDATWNRSITWPTAINPAPNLDSGQPPATVVLAPGRYPSLDVKSGRTLRLTAGEYFLDGLTVNSGAGLQIDGSGGPVFVYILDAGLTFRGSMAGGVNTPGMPVPSLTVMTTGSVTAEAPFTGVVIAPNGFVNLKGSFANHRGAVFGRNITIFEDNRLFHYRDPYSFRNFGPTDPNVAIGERASVTGGSIRLPTQDVTDESNQTESVSAVSRNGSTNVITVGYNDFTTSPSTTSILYTDFTAPSGDARDGAGRLVTEGTSLMGWSFSTDGGRTFTYGGRVAPPPNWSIVWGDPAMAKANIDDPNVYYAQMSGSTAHFRSGWDPMLQAVSGPINDAVLDGHCVARSTDRGRTFPSVKCTSGNFQDGTALAVAVDSNNHRKVYLTGSKASISRLDGDTMTFDGVTFPNPITLGPNQFPAHHPRMRVFNGILYFARLLDTADRQQGFAVVVNRLNALANSTTWMGQVIVATFVDATKVSLGDGTTFALGDEFSFDIGPDANGVNKFRVMYVATDTNPTTPGSRVEVRECDLDLTNCRTTGWSTAGNAGNEVDPSLRFGGGRWVAAWREQDPGAPLNTVRPVAGQLNTGISGVEALVQRALSANIIPCFFGDKSFARWGEYDHIDALGDGRFFAPYPVSGPGCRWQGLFTSDTHISGTVFGF